MRKWLLAACVGGAIGTAGFLAGRYAPAKAAETSAADPAAREVVRGLLEKLKRNDPDGFATAARAQMHLVPDPEFLARKDALVKAREQHLKALGKSTGEFELVREQAAGSAVVRIVYVEKFERGGVAWYFVLSRGTEGWKLADVNWDPTLTAAFAGL